MPAKKKAAAPEKAAKKKTEAPKKAAKKKTAAPKEPAIKIDPKRSVFSQAKDLKRKHEIPLSVALKTIRDGME